MSKVLLDTHVLIWLLAGEPRLGKITLKIINDALKEDNLYVCAISFWEIALLVDRKKIKISNDTHIWRKEVLALGIQEYNLCGHLAISSVHLQNMHADPADRMIVATAKHHGCTLLTSDKKILNLSEKLQTQDAAK